MRCSVNSSLLLTITYRYTGTWQLFRKDAKRNYLPKIFSNAKLWSLGLIEILYVNWLNEKMKYKFIKVLWYWPHDFWATAISSDAICTNNIIFRAIKLNRYLLKFILFQKLFSTTSLIKMLLVVWMSLVQIPFEPKSQNQVIFNKTFCHNVLSGNNKLGCLLVQLI